LRESLSRLVAEDLVVGEHRRGFRVAPMTEADLRDLPQDIEVLAVTTSVRRGDDLWEADLVRAFHHMKLLTPGSPNYLVERSTRHPASRETLGYSAAKALYVDGGDASSSHGRHDCSRVYRMQVAATAREGSAYPEGPYASPTNPGSRTDWGPTFPVR
jgi:hypothetical protein